MAVIDGQKVSASVTNAAFISTSQGGDTTGVLGLKRGLSGPDINDVQDQLNKTIKKGELVASISAGGQISVDDIIGTQVYSISSESGPVTMSTTNPFNASSPISGQEIILIGTSDTDTVTLENVNLSGGVALAGQITFVAGTLLRLIYNSTLDRWVESNRNYI